MLFLVILLGGWRSFCWALLGSLVQLQTPNTLTGAQRPQMFSVSCLSVSAGCWPELLTSPYMLCDRGPQDHPQACWLTRKTHRTQESCYGYGYGLLWRKDADQNQQRQKAHGTKSNRNESQASKYLLSVQSPGDMLNSPGSDVWRHMQSIASQESSPNHSVLGLYCSTHVTDLGYSDPSSPEVKFIQQSPKPQAYINALRQDRPGAHLHTSNLPVLEDTTGVWGFQGWKWKLQGFLRPIALEVTQDHFGCTVLAGASHKSSPEPNGWENPLFLLMEGIVGLHCKGGWTRGGVIHRGHCYNHILSKNSSTFFTIISKAMAINPIRSFFVDDAFSFLKCTVKYSIHTISMKIT